MKRFLRRPIVSFGLVVTVAAASASSVLSPASVWQTDATAHRQATTSLHPYVSMHGPHSEIAERRIVRLTDAEAWRALMIEHRGDAIEKHAGGTWPIVPEIDFDRCMVIAIFEGDSWNCNGLQIVAAEDLGDEIRLRFTTRTFQTAGPDGGGIRVRPFGIFILPRSDKAVSIERNVQNLKEADPIWKEVARFGAM